MKKDVKILVSVMLSMLVFATITTIAQNIEENSALESENKDSPMSLVASFLGIGRDILYVGGTGPNNYTTIQEAIDNASEGDTIFVYDDSSPYVENIVINTTLSLVGEQKETTIINGSEEGNVIEVYADDVSITGFSILRNSWSDDGLWVRANHTQVIGNIINNSGYGFKTYQTNNHVISQNVFIGCHVAIQISKSEGNAIDNNSLYDNYLSGITLFSTANSSLADNYIRANTHLGIQPSYNGIRLSESTGNSVVHNTIESILDNGWSGLALWYSYGNVIKANDMIKTGLDWYKSSENQIIDNIVNGKPLVFLVNETDMVIDNAGQVILVNCERITVQNLDLQNLENGIHLYQTDDSLIQQNYLSLCWKGIWLDESYSNVITDNTLDENDYGISVRYGSDNIVSDNTVENSDYVGIHVSSRKTTIQGNLLHNCSGGVFLSGRLFPRNKVLFNRFQECRYGIWIQWTSTNLIMRNDFFSNEHDAWFDTALANHWVKNYWGGPTLVPHKIPGEILLYEYYPPTGGGYEIRIPWANYDLRPAKIPNYTA